MTYIMSSNQKGSLAAADKTPKWHERNNDEKHLLKLLSLVSSKINERFRNMREAFRYIDTDHSQSISINEFAQAIEYFRLKLSFEDIAKLYRFLDSEAKGELGYEEFTMLSEENWRDLDPYKHYQQSVEKHRAAQQHSESALSSIVSGMGDSHASQMGVKSNDAAGYQKLEDLARNHLKIPIKRVDKETGFMNINRLDPGDLSDFLSQSLDIQAHGIASEPPAKMTSVLKHDYLRKSMVDRIERKSLLQQYRQSMEREVRERRQRPTKTQILRDSVQKSYKESNNGSSHHDLYVGKQLHSPNSSKSLHQLSQSSTNQSH